MVQQIWRWHKEWGVDEVWQEKRGQTHEDFLAPLKRTSSNENCFTRQPSQDLRLRKDDLSEIKTLGALREALENFDGCALKETALHTVFCDGNPSSRVMVVGEAPGADEDRLGKPFVGVSGQLLDGFFAGIGLNRTQIYVSNVIPWRPPGNRQPTTTEIEVCRPFIERHISLVDPQFLLIVGGTAAKALLKKSEGITRLRGQWIPYENPCLSKPIMALATFHPAYLLRSPGQKREVWQDFLILQQKIIMMQEGSHDTEKLIS